MSFLQLGLDHDTARMRNLAAKMQRQILQLGIKGIAPGAPSVSQSARDPSAAERGGVSALRVSYDDVSQGPASARNPASLPGGTTKTRHLRLIVWLHLAAEWRWSLGSRCCFEFAGSGAGSALNSGVHAREKRAVASMMRRPCAACGAGGEAEILLAALCGVYLSGSVATLPLRETPHVADGDE